MQQPIYSVASRKILEIQVLRPFFKAFLSRIQVFHYFSSIFLFFTKGCGKCRCSIMGLVYLVVRKWMMEMVFLLTTTLLFLVFQYSSIITHPALWAPLLLEGNGLWCSKKLGNFGEQVCFRWLVLFYAPKQGDFGERGKNRGLLFLFSVGTLGLQIENNV